MIDKAMKRLIELEEIHLQLHCSIEAVRQSWIAMTQEGNQPCADDYDALYGIYCYLSELEKRLLEWKESYWEYSK